jgi:hypothetical protein
MESKNFFEKDSQQKEPDHERSVIFEEALILARRMASLKDTVLIEKFVKLRNELVNKYGKDIFYRCELYHKLNNSGIMEGSQSFFDLPEGEFKTFIDENIGVKEK